MHSMRLKWLSSSTVRGAQLAASLDLCFIYMLGPALHSDDSYFNVFGYSGVRRHCLRMMRVCAPYMHVALSGRCEIWLPRRQVRGWGSTGVPGLSQAAAGWGLPSAAVQQEVELAESLCMREIAATEMR